MFVKLFTQILDSSIADDRRLRHFFTDLLLCADGEGFVMMTPTALARRIGAPVKEVEWGISELEKPDPRSKTPDNEGRRIEAVEGSGYGWRILNYVHYRSMKDANQLRESVKIRVQRHRAKKAGTKQGVGGNGDVTHGNACNAMQKHTQRAEEETDSPIAPKGAKVWEPSVNQVRVSEWFKRRPSTAWSPTEVKKWSALTTDVITEGITILNAPYSQRVPYIRKDLETLLNNWQTEIDRWRDWSAGSGDGQNFKTGPKLISAGTDANGNELVTLY